MKFGFFFFQKFSRHVFSLPNRMKFWEGKISFKASMLNKKKNQNLVHKNSILKQKTPIYKWIKKNISNVTIFN